MPDALLRIIEKLMDLAKGPLCVAAGLLLLLYALKVNAFELYSLLSSSIAYPAIIFIIFIASGMFLLGDFLAQCKKWLYKFNLERKSRKAACDKLRYYLTHQQKEALQLLVVSPNHSDYFIGTEHVEELATYDIILSRAIPQSERTLGYYGKYLYTIQPWASKYLKKHPDLLKTK